MKLTNFRVQNFRSINDSGIIRMDDKTALVGRNESGKSNLLLALESLNPAGGTKALSKIKNFPRHRRLDECTDYTRVVDTWWNLDDAERQILTGIFPAAKKVKQVIVSRYYAAGIYVTVGVNAPKLDIKALKTSIRKMDAHNQGLSCSASRGFLRVEKCACSS